MKLQDLNIEIPEWIEQDIETDDIEAIVEGGCSSGAYMPAVRYYDAIQTMSQHGDDVLEFIDNVLGEVPAPPKESSWSGIAVHYLSTAVELWAFEVESEVKEALERVSDER